MNKTTKLVIIIVSLFVLVIVVSLGLVVGFIALNPGGLALPWRNALGL